MLPVILGVARIGAVALRAASTGISAVARVAVRGIAAGARSVGRGIAAGARSVGTDNNEKSNNEDATRITNNEDNADTTTNEDTTDENKNNIQKSKETSLVGSATILNAISNQISILRKTVEEYESVLFKREQSSEAANIENEIESEDIADATNESAKSKKKNKTPEGFIQKLLGGLLFTVFAFLPPILKFFSDSKDVIKALPQKIIDSFKGIIDSISSVIKEYVIDPVVKFFTIDVGAALDTMFIFIGDKIDSIMDIPKKMMNAVSMAVNEIVTKAVTTFIGFIEENPYLKSIHRISDALESAQKKLERLKVEKNTLVTKRDDIEVEAKARETTTISGTFNKQQATRQAQYDKEHPPVAKPEREVNAPKVQGMDDVKAMVKRHEGIRKQAYEDSVGKWTIGVGHLIGNGSSPGEYAGKTLTNKEVDDLFEEDFAHHVKIAEKTPGWNLANDSGKAAMIDLAFNMGAWWHKWKDASKALTEGNFDAAADALIDSKWYTQVGDRAKEIVAMMRGGKGGATDESTGTAVAEVPAGVGEQIVPKPKPEVAATTPQVAVVVPPASPTGGNAGGTKTISAPDPNQVQRLYATSLGIPGTTA